MSALVLDGAAVSEATLARVAEAARALGLTPGLAVVLVGSDPASQVYVALQGQGGQALRLSLRCNSTCRRRRARPNCSRSSTRLNEDPAIHGILVQLPLPKAIDATRVLEAIDPAKDVDGFHPVNVGLAASGVFERALIPCTPAGSMILVDRACEALGLKLDGLEAVVIGRSNIVGKPMAQLLLARNCTVTIAHSRTRDLPAVARRADVLVAAVGRPEMVKGDWVKPGAIVIDVGINRIPAPEKGEGKTRLVGDVAYGEAAQSRRRDHAGARRRRQDDDRHADGQHADRRPRARKGLTARRNSRRCVATSAAPTFGA